LSWIGLDLDLLLPVAVFGLNDHGEVNLDDLFVSDEQRREEGLVEESALFVLGWSAALAP
jgi:hypothetical protein